MQKSIEIWLKENYDIFSEKCKKIDEGSQSKDFVFNKEKDDYDKIEIYKKPETYNPVPNDVVEKFCEILAPLILKWVIDKIELKRTQTMLPGFDAIDVIFRQSLGEGYNIYTYIYNNYFEKKEYDQFTYLNPNDWIMKKKEISARSTSVRTKKNGEWTKKLILKFVNSMVEDKLATRGELGLQPAVKSAKSGF